MEHIYLDYAATTPVHPRVLRAMEPYFSERFGNAGSLHSFGQEAIAAIDRSRETIANAIGAQFREIIFTGSATEANNLALRGSIRGLTQTVRGLTQKNIKTTTQKFSVSHREVSVSLQPRLIISAVEHESILETARDLENDGTEVIIIPVDRHGIVDLKKLKSALNERTILVSVMYANNEIGTIQPIAKISEIIRNFREELRIKNNELRKRKKASFIIPLFHVDAVQALQFLDCNTQDLGIDLMTLSAHKIYGPKGVGALYVNQRSKIKNQNLGSDFITPIIIGGGQEFGLRSGTENVPAIVGFAKATELIFSNSRELANKKIAGLRDYLWRGIAKIYPQAQFNGISDAKNANAMRMTRIKNNPQHSNIFADSHHAFLPNILNIYFPDFAADELLTRLDLAGVAASAGSACAARSVAPSHVLAALGYTPERIKKSVRFSLGRPTTKTEINKTLRILKTILS